MASASKECKQPLVKISEHEDQDKRFSEED
jgi:hypothetical protein